MYYGFDIETIPNTAMLDRLPEPEVATGNLKDPEKIKEKEAEARRKQIERMALDPLYGRVCCAVLISEDGDKLEFINDGTDAGETEMIESIMRAFAQGTKLATWNGMGFDLPFLYKRALLLGIDIEEFNAPRLGYWMKRYATDPHADLMQIWSNWNSQQFSKLDDVAKVFFDGTGKLQVDFREFPELLKTEEGRRTLLDYCAQDVQLTIDLHTRFSRTII